jgi:hypothetical protein
MFLKITVVRQGIIVRNEGSAGLRGLGVAGSMGGSIARLSIGGSGGSAGSIGSTIKITGGTHGGNFPAKFFRNQLTLVQLFLVGGWRKVSGPVETKFVGVHFFFVFFDHHRRRFTQCLCQGRQPFVVFGGPRKQR